MATTRSDRSLHSMLDYVENCQEFTYEESEKVMCTAIEQLIPNANSPMLLAIHHLFNVRVAVAVLVAFIAYQLRPIASHGPHASMNYPWTAAPKMATVEVSTHLRNLEASIRLLDNHAVCADSVKSLAENSLAMTNNATLRNALEALTFAPAVHKNAADGMWTALTTAKTAKEVLHDTVVTVQSAVEQVPADAEAALIHFRQTLDKVDGRLNTEIVLIDSAARPIKKLQKHRELLAQLNEVLILVTKSPQPKCSWGFCRSLETTVWGPDKGQLESLQTLSKKLTNGPMHNLANTCAVFAEYAEMLQRLADELRTGEIDDERWITMTALQASKPESVAPAVKLNFEMMVERLVQLKF
ncbi:hypothetical protein IWX47DRAFT_678570 [Phyllosticta citricarpa]